MSASREDVMNALLKRFQDMPEFNTATRKLKLWDSVPAEDQPYVCLVEPNEDNPVRGRGLPRRLFMLVDLWIYFKPPSSDENQPGSAVLNNLLDAIETGALANEPGLDICTLGGLVNRVWIEGTTLKDSGDLEGQGLAIVPVKILFP